MNTWQILHNSLRNWASRLPPGSVPQSLKAEQLINREVQSVPAIDAMVRTFGRGQPPGEPSPEQAYFLHQRLAFATLVSKVLCVPGSPPDVTTATALPTPPETFGFDLQVEWLLIGAWNHEGRRAWRERVLGVQPRF